MNEEAIGSTRQLRERPLMRWRYVTVLAGLLVLWAAFAAWQWREYGHEQRLARRILPREAEALSTALAGRIRLHRRLGYLAQGQLQEVLQEVTQSENVLAVAVVSRDGRTVLSAGQTDLLDTSETTPGSYWDPAGFRSVSSFQLESPGFGGPFGPGGGPRGPGGGGPRGPGGGGRGFGRGPRWQPPADQPGPFVNGPPPVGPKTPLYLQPPADDSSPFFSSGSLVAILVLDRTQIDDYCHRAFWLRVWVTIAGGLVLICVGLAWLATVRLIEARARARVLETEARHLRDLGQAAAGLAHETRNPLGLIRGWTQRLGQTNLQSAEQQQQARTIVEECDRVTSRINQFLAFARPREPSLERVDSGRLVEELAVLLEPDLDAKGLKLDRSLPQPPPTVQADREMFRQALFNLVRNAIQFAPEEGAVEILVGSGQDGGYRIEVADRGPGVPDEKVESLFTPYFTTRADGTGLGLAIVRRIAAAHGWRAGYTPRPGGGSVFWLDHIRG
jgi:signal transduction histidine kinase